MPASRSLWHDARRARGRRHLDRPRRRRPRKSPAAHIAAPADDTGCHRELAVVSDAYVFTVNGRKPLSNFSGLKRELDTEMAKVAGKPVKPWRLHDLRRTFASNLAALGVALPVVERLLNHVSGSFAVWPEIYQRHEFRDEKAEALLRWAVHLRGLVGGKPDNVAKLPSRKRTRAAEDAGVR